ncbi:MAG: glycosyltransferase family A protein [Candidatus Binataceae bacterium]|jgi:glycosyltransferase involved in cell wall biosynthesis
MAARVTVIVPVYNGAATVAAALDSILAQSFTDFEIVAVDDGSTDNSITVLERYHPRVRIVTQPNRGPSAARNLGVVNSSGEYIGFLDADDLWRPAFLERTVAMLEKDAASVLVYTDLELADSTGELMEARLIGARGVPTVNDMLERLWPILPSSVLMRRDAFDRAGGFPEALTSFEDVYFWLLAREQGGFSYIDEPLAIWRFALFPAPLKPGGGQEAAGRIFDQMLKRRYGVRGLAHVSARERAPRSILGYIGLHALARGDQLGARRAFGAALRTDPWRLKNYLRYARTYLPAAIARALSGGRAGNSQHG